MAQIEVQTDPPGGRITVAGTDHGPAPTVLEFDPMTETITNSKEANAMLTKEYREPYGLPKSV